MVGAVAAPDPGPVPVAGGVVVAGLVRSEAGPPRYAPFLGVTPRPAAPAFGPVVSADRASPTSWRRVSC